MGSLDWPSCRHLNADQAAAGNNPGLAEFFKNLINSEFTITYGKGFVVEKVEGRDEFLKKLGTSNPQIEGLLKKILTEEALRTTISCST